MLPTSQLKTLSPANRFTFACPIFGSEVELRGCLHLHSLHITRQAPTSRLGCQAAMSSSKCPVWHMHQLMRQGRDEWHADEPKGGTLGNDVVSRIARIQTSEKTCNEFGLPPQEAKLLLEANQMWERGAAKPVKGAKAAVKPASSVVEPRTKSSKSEIAKAARSGDLAAAINEAAAA